MGFPGGSDGKESACSAGDLSLIPGSGRCLAEGNGYPHQYSCLKNSMDIGAWQPTVHGVTESDMTEQLMHTPRIYLSIYLYMLCSVMGFPGQSVGKEYIFFIYIYIFSLYIYSFIYITYITPH